MSDALIVAILGLLAAPVAAVITWIANRRKNIGQIYSVLTESAQSAVETMQSTMETLHEELQAAQAKIDELIQENHKMQGELAKLRQQNMLLLQENHSLHKKVDDLMRAFVDTGEIPIVSDSVSSQHDN